MYQFTKASFKVAVVEDVFYMNELNISETIFAFIWIFLGIFPVWCYCLRMIKKATVTTMEHWLFDINKKLFLSLYGLWHERRIVCDTGATPGQPVPPQVSLKNH